MSEPDLRIDQIDKYTWRDRDGIFLIRRIPDTGKKYLEMTYPNTFPLLEDLARVDEYFKTRTIAKLQDVDGGDQDLNTP